MNKELLRDLVRLGVQTTISLLLVGSGLYVMLTFDWGEQREIVLASAGWIGLTAGYWLK